MSSTPDRAFAPETPASLDRPLTVPLLIGGGFDNCLFVVLGLLSCVLIVRGTFASLGSSPDRKLAETCLFLAGLFGLPALLMGLWRLPQRRWIEVTLTGFVLTRGGRRRNFSDADIIGLSRRMSGASAGRVHYRAVLQVRHAGKAECIRCSYLVYPNQEDPLAAFWNRQIRGLAQRTLVGLPDGARLEGTHWSLDTSGLRCWVGIRVESYPLEQISKVGYYEGQLRIWNGDEERPFLRLPIGGHNVEPLGLVLSERISADWEKGRPDPDRPLGRILLERHGRELGLGLVVIALGLLFLVGVFSVLAAKEPGGILESPSIFFLGYSLIAIGSGLHLCWRSRKMHLILHEFGVSQPGRGKSKQMFYSEIGSLVWKTGPNITFRPLPGLDRPAIHYSRSWMHPVNASEDLTNLREHICRVMARRWWDDLANEPVTWTPRLRFLPGGLEYRPAGLLGDGEPICVAYHLTSFRIEQGRFLLFVAGSDTAVCKVRREAPNYYPGLMLLVLIYEDLQRQQAGQDSNEAPGELSPHVFSAAPAPRWQRQGRHDEHVTAFDPSTPARGY